MQRTAAAGSPRLAGSPDEHLIAGCDPTEGIVAVEADSLGRARVWQRVGARVELSEQRFANWFLATGLDLLAHLPARLIDRQILRDAHGTFDHLTPPPDGIAIIELDATDLAPDAEAYRYLVLVDDFADVSTTIAEMSNKRDGGDAQSLDDLRGVILAWPPIDQFLILSGRTLFKGMRYPDLRRLQFDLETTGLDEDRDRIFMISMRDSTGWHDCMDIGSWSEARLIERFVEAVQARDPDILENHNIFGFDLPFLARRAARLGTRLRLGRDGSEPRVETDVFDGPERAEPFLRWCVAGRQVVDTQHAVRRFAFGSPDLRRHGLKEAARYFGLAGVDREYVAGVDVWPTYRTDPDRIRRYAASDVDEVDGLSRRLLPPVFGLAQKIPRAYERIAADSAPSSLWEPLVARAYLHEGRAMAVSIPRDLPEERTPLSRVVATGVVAPAARVTAVGLVPRLVAASSASAAVDALGVVPRVVGWALGQPDDVAAQALAASAHPHLSGPGLLSEPSAAELVSRQAASLMARLTEELEARGCTVVAIDGATVSCGLPSTWSTDDVNVVAEAARAWLPLGVQLEWSDRFAALYTRAAKTGIALGQHDEVTVVGAAFRPGRGERFGETFVRRIAPSVLRGDALQARSIFLETVHALRTGQIPLSELCVQAMLHKSPPQYRRAGVREEPYEVLLAAGVRSWRVGQRIRYFRARGREARLSTEADGLSSLDADTEFYVQRLSSTYCSVFDKAFEREDLQRVFRIPAGCGPYVDDESTRERIAEIRPLAAAAVQHHPGLLHAVD